MHMKMFKKLLTAKLLEQEKVN